MRSFGILALTYSLFYLATIINANEVYNSSLGWEMRPHRYRANFVIFQNKNGSLVYMSRNKTMLQFDFENSNDPCRFRLDSGFTNFYHPRQLKNDNIAIPIYWPPEMIINVINTTECSNHRYPVNNEFWGEKFGEEHEELAKMYPDWNSISRIPPKAPYIIANHVVYKILPDYKIEKTYVLDEDLVKEVVVYSGDNNRFTLCYKENLRSPKLHCIDMDSDLNDINNEFVVKGGHYDKSNTVLLNLPENNGWRLVYYRFEHCDYSTPCARFYAQRIYADGASDEPVKLAELIEDVNLMKVFQKKDGSFCVVAFANKFDAVKCFVPLYE